MSAFWLFIRRLGERRSNKLKDTMVNADNMKQNTEQLKKEFYDLMPNMILPMDSKEPNAVYLERDRVWNFFLPHLISSDEIKREAVREFCDFNKEYLKRTGHGFIDIEKVEHIWGEYLTQSKEGGE